MERGKWGEIMIKIIAHDIINDVAIIQTAFCYNVRYGLEVKPFDNLHHALRNFHDCQHHALNCEGLFD